MEEQAEGWTVARLGDVCEVNPRKPPADLLERHAPVTFIPMAAVDEIQGAITRRETRPYGDVRKGYTAFAEGDVILAKITPCFENGKAAIATDLKNDIGFGSSEFHVLHPLGGVIAKYIYHYFRQPRFREEAANHMTGTAGQERVSVEYVRDHELPIPPAAEQWRIIEKVEALLTRVSAARERLERVPRLLKRFRQAVLAAACEGRLTEEWRAEHPQASLGELLKQLDSVRLASGKLKAPVPPTSEFEFDLPPSWIALSLDRITVRITSGSRAWSRYYSEDGRSTFIMAQNVRPMVFDLSFRQGIEPPEYDPERARAEARENDILVTIVGANTGDVCRVDQPLVASYVCQSVALVRPASPLVSRFLELWLNSPAHGQQQFDSWTYGEGRPHLSFDQLRATAIGLPPLFEQQEIVRRVQAFFSLADTIERRVTAALARAEKLPQAILSRAFAGELVSTEDEMARREGRDYETAEELLARIRLDREASAEEKSPRRRTEAAPRRSAAKSGNSRR